MSTLIRFDESHYFICTGGLKPARFKADPRHTKRDDKNYYLNMTSRTCKGMDFSCRYIALYGAILGALIAALCATGAGALLVGALIGAAVFAAGSTALSVCGTMVAIMRDWETSTWTWGTKIERYPGVANRTPPHLTCKVLFSNTISFAPNVTSEFHALFLFAVNIGLTGIEGFLWIYGFKGLGVLLKSRTQFLINFGANYLKSWSKKGILVRGFFGLWGGFDAYSRSNNEMTAKQALTSGEVWMGAAGGFGFFESAMLHAAQGDPTSIMFLLTMGSGANPHDRLKVVDIAREYRSMLRNMKNGIGAKEAMLSLKEMKNILQRPSKLSNLRKLTPEELRDLMRLKITNPALFSNNIARGKLRIIDIDTGEVYFEKNYTAASGKRNFDGFSKKAQERFPGEKKLFEDSKGKNRWNDTENKILREMDADIQENQRPNTRVEIEIETQLEPCEVCSREINAREKMYDTEIEVKSSESKTLENFEKNYPEYKNPNNKD
jgi:hypothetical protein